MENILVNIRRILHPIQQNLTLFVISIILLGGFDVGYQQHLFHENKPIDILTGYMEIIFIAYGICLLSYLFRKLYIKILFYLILFILYGLSCYLLYAYSSYITPNILMLLLETNSKEATGFFQTYLMTPAMFKSITIIGFLLIMTIIGEIFNKSISKIASNSICSIIMMIVFLFGVVGCFGVVKRYWELSQCKTSYDAESWKSNHLFYKVMPIPNFCYSVTAVFLASQYIYQMIDTTKETLKNVQPTDGDSLNVVLVIGESFNKYHASLYGYSLNTTPNQCEEKNQGNLYAYTHVKAPHNMTSIVLKNMLSCNNVQEGEKWYEHSYFPAIFKKAGFNVWLWDNQYQTNANMAYNFTLNSILFNKDIEQLSYTAYNDTCTTYDDEFISIFKRENEAKLGNRNLIIFHLTGQHRPANIQYPQDKEYQIFTAQDIKKTAHYLTDESRQRIAEYDNATHFNDKVLKQIIDLVRDTKAVLIYFSDHGEEVYDYRDFLGRSLLEEAKITPELVKYQLEIPFIVWASDKWKQQNEAEWQRMGEAIDQEFSIDNVCHLLFRLGGIKTKEYKPERDLFSPDFIPQTKEYDIWNVL